MTIDETKIAPSPRVSIAIFAWNEEHAIPGTLQSLLRQSLFTKLQGRGELAEVVCVLNGCTDRTADVAKAVFERAAAPGCACRVVEVTERGKVNAWNQFVHSVSAAGAQVLFMMDADILIHRPNTLWNMLQVLESNPEVSVAVDRPCKDILFKPRKSFRETLSLASSRVTLAAEAQLCGQLYAIRAGTARRIYLPRDLAACEDGFLKALVCTDLLEHEVWPGKIRVANDAEHTFEAYTSPGAILRNQKRQMIGQTIVHILIDKHLSLLPVAERRDLAGTLRRKEATDPFWLKKLIAEHLREVRHFWKLYPGLLGQKFKALRCVKGFRKALCLPAAMISSTAGLVSSWMAWRSLRSGCTDYWPKAKRLGLTPLPTQEPSRLGIGINQ